MVISRILRTVIPAAILIALIAILFFPNASAASDGITVGGAALVAEVTPGETYNHKITISLGLNEPGTMAFLEVLNIEQAADGTFLCADTTKSPFSACEYLSLSRDSVQLIPGKSQEIVLSINVPLNVTDCGLYALVHIQTQPSGAGTIGVISAINIPVFLTIKNALIVHQGEITSVFTETISSGKPVDIITCFKNTGNHHFKFCNEVTIRDIAGNTVDTLFANLTQNSVIPGMSRESRVIFIPTKELETGMYSIHSKIISENGLVYDEADSTFELTAPVLPPVSPATVTILPAEPAYLKTAGGHVSITFPKGAVTEPVNTTLREYPLSQLPPLPLDYQPTVICFRVDGINGLLLKEAAITVKFTPADLEKAGNDAGRLKLAYWDETSKNWTVLKTSVNNREMTVTASTNHFSIWTVTIAPQKQHNWISIALVIVSSVIVISGVLLFLKKRKR